MAIMPKKRTPGPSSELMDRGLKVCSLIESDSDAPGAITTEEGVLQWRFLTGPARGAWSLRNLIRKPEFVVFDSDGRELLRIRRESRFPPRFEMTRDSRVVGRIALRSFLRNKYSIALSDQTTWLFRMPLFTILFRGASDSGSEVWVFAGPGKRQWNILLGGEGDGLYILSALAFIHREWWLYG
jgi:hypothetical protein